MLDVLEDIFVAFPDYHLRLEAVLDREDQIVVLWTVPHRGMARWAFAGTVQYLAPTGKKFSVGQMFWYRVAASRSGSPALTQPCRDRCGGWGDRA